MEHLTYTATGSVTAAGLVGVTMLVKSGENDEGRWFDYVPGYFADTIRIEWKKDSMRAVLPADIAKFLTTRGWAKAMTESDVQAYNNGLAPKTAAVAPPAEPKKEPVPAPEKETKP